MDVILIWQKAYCFTLLVLWRTKMIFINYTLISQRYLQRKWHSHMTRRLGIHYNDVMMSAMAYQITSLTIVYSVVYSGADQRKHQSSASLAFIRGIHRWPVNSPHKMASNAENVSIWWRHHTTEVYCKTSTISLAHGISDCVCKWWYFALNACLRAKRIMMSCLGCYWPHWIWC